MTEIKKGNRVTIMGLDEILGTKERGNIIVVAVLGVIYNSPLAVFFPLPDTGYENPRTVLSSYYIEFNKKVMAIEENGEERTYQNTENGAQVSNFNDTLMVYMILYGDGKTGFVMDEDGKKNLKKIFDEMNYIDSASSAVEKEVGIDLPATASPQGKYCYENAMLVNKKDLKPGALIFYSYEENGEFRNISHVVIYVGDGMMVHAANPRRGVVYDPLRDSNVVFYARQYK